jgi:CBS domain-containing protein
MFDQPIKNVMERNSLLIAPPETSVSNAARLMAAQNVGAVIIVENDHVTGIFTERDAVFRVIAQERDPPPRAARCHDRQSKVLASDKSMATHGIDAGERFRHVPVIDDGRLVGVVTSRNAMDPDLEEFISEERRREYLQR